LVNLGLADVSAIRCSPANTLILNGLEFHGEQLSERPDTIEDARSHTWCSLNPLGANEPRLDLLALRQWQWQSQALVRTGKIVEGLKESDTPSHLFSIFAKSQALSGKRGKGMSKGQEAAPDGS
jgi:hypothetical protein